MPEHDSKTTWLIQGWIPPDNSIGGKGFWTTLQGMWFDSEEDARLIFGTLKKAHRAVRLIKETREVVE